MYEPESNLRIRQPPSGTQVLRQALAGQTEITGQPCFGAKRLRGMPDLFREDIPKRGLCSRSPCKTTWRLATELRLCAQIPDVRGMSGNFHRSEERIQSIEVAFNSHDKLIYTHGVQ